MTNFEKLKSEMDVWDVANKRFVIDEFTHSLKNDVCTYEFSGDGDALAETFKLAYNDEIEWLNSDAREKKKYEVK
jgi:hypothetical protein